MKKKTKYSLISVASIVVFIGVWHLATAVFELFPSYLMPSPLEVVKAFISKLTELSPDGGTLFTHIGTSMRNAVLGFVFATLIGVPLGVCMSWYKKFERFVRPLFDLLRPISPIAWIPLTVLWFGIGIPSKVFIIFLAAFVPTVINAYTGIKQTSDVHIWVAKTFGASDFEILKKVAIPSALPMIFTGLRISLGVSWGSLVAAELLAADSGLGYMIQVARGIGRPDIIVVGMLTIGGLGALIAFVLGKIERRFVRGGE